LAGGRDTFLTGGGGLGLLTDDSPGDSCCFSVGDDRLVDTGREFLVLAELFSVNVNEPTGAEFLQFATLTTLLSTVDGLALPRCGGTFPDLGEVVATAGLLFVITLFVLTCRAFCLFAVATTLPPVVGGLAKACGVIFTLLTEVLVICLLGGMLAELFTPARVDTGVLSTVLIG